MSKILITIVVAVGLVLGAWALFARGDSGTTEAPPQNEVTSTNTANQAVDDTEQAKPAGTINITNKMFTPSQITVQRGQTVMWTNNDTVAHTVTNDRQDQPGPFSKSIAPGETYSFTFETSGSFQYHCDLHPSMRGTIVVQ